MSFFKWSKTANNNATADATINWAEGQAPSTVNDSARAMMAAAAKYRDDVAGTITTGGTSTAYTVTSNQLFDSLANMSGKTIAFVPHATNGATVTLNVDGLGAKPLRSAPGVELPAGVLIQGTPYGAVYNNAAAEWILQGFYGAGDYSIPLAAGMAFFGTSAPNSKFAFPFGQALSRTTYAALHALFASAGYPYGSGDGSTTFNLPDLRGRGLFGKDDMGGSAANRITAGGSGITGTALGAAGGAETHTLTAAQLASHTHANVLSDLGHTHNGTTGGASADHTHTFSGTTSTESADHTHGYGGPGGGFTGGGGGITAAANNQGSTAGVSASHTHNYSGTTSGISADHTHSFITSSNLAVPMSLTNAAAGSGNAHNNMPPTMMVNFIMRVL
jgi:microcystin-dependent protein